MKNVKFELSFLDAMQAVLNGNAVQGELFDQSCYLTEKDGIVLLNMYVDDSFNRYKSLGNMFITKAALEQKYRLVSVLNKAGLFYQ